MLDDDEVLSLDLRSYGRYATCIFPVSRSLAVGTWLAGSGLLTEYVDLLASMDLRYMYLTGHH